MNLLLTIATLCQITIDTYSVSFISKAQLKCQQEYILCMGKYRDDEKLRACILERKI